MRSISKAITYKTILWVALILATGQIVVDRVVTSWLLEQFDNALESKARALVTLTKFDGSEVELDFADEFMPEFESPNSPEYFELFLGDGSLLERSNSFNGYAASQFADQSSEVIVSDTTLPDGRNGRRIAIKFIPQIEDKALRKKIPLEKRPRAILRVSLERESLDLVITRAIKLGLEPLNQINDEISQISPRSIDRRITSKGQPAELEPIATQFNLALSEIEKAFIRERQFSSDVAHELRTPVSEIRSLAEVGLRWPDEKDIRSYFGDIHDSATQLDHLIENLLYLCRSEEGDIKLEYSDIPLKQELEKVCRGFDKDVSERNLSMRLPGQELPVIHVDAQLFEQVLKNLIFNAISHSPTGETVSIRSKINAGYCTLEIENKMLDPLSTADLEMIFKRFWRKDSARQSGGHAGIGLSLVKIYADLMKLELNTSILEGERFLIILSNIKTV